MGLGAVLGGIGRMGRGLGSAIANNPGKTALGVGGSGLGYEIGKQMMREDLTDEQVQEFTNSLIAAQQEQGRRFNDDEVMKFFLDAGLDPENAAALVGFTKRDRLRRAQ